MVSKTSSKTRGLIPLYFLLSLLVLTFVSAKVPSTTIGNNIGASLIIEYPIREYYKLNSPAELYIHIFNYSGVAVTNTTTKCEIHIYNAQEHIVQEILKGSSNKQEFKINLPSNITNKLGIYPTLIYCNKTGGEYGFIKFSYEVTPNGESWDKNSNYLLLLGYFIIIGILLFLTHTFKEDGSSPFIYGTIGATISFIFSSLIWVQNFWFSEIIFYNNSIALLITLIGIYFIYISYNFYSIYSPKVEA